MQGRQARLVRVVGGEVGVIGVLQGRQVCLVRVVGSEYLALEDGPPIFRQDYTCPALVVADLVPPGGFCVRGYHPVSPDFPVRFTNHQAKDCRLLRVRSPLLTESRLISVPAAT